MREFFEIVSGCGIIGQSCIDWICKCAKMDFFLIYANSRLPFSAMAESAFKYPSFLDLRILPILDASAFPKIGSLVIKTIVIYVVNENTTRRPKNFSMHRDINPSIWSKAHSADSIFCAPIFMQIPSKFGEFFKVGAIDHGEFVLADRYQLRHAYSL